MSDGKKNRAFTILGSVAVGVVLLASIYFWWTGGSESTDDAQVSADIVPIAPRVGGLVKEVYVTENKLVKAGDPLVLIDDADYQARMKRAEAELASAEAQAAAADAQVQVVEASSKGGLQSA